MSAFFVDLPGLKALAASLERASSDARDTRSYTGRHCDLSFATEGYIFMLAGPHAKAYGSVTKALERIKELTHGGADQLGQAQKAYAGSDSAACGRLDRSYPGAKSPAQLYEILSPGRPDQRRTQADFAGVDDPTSYLVAPNYVSAVETYQINLMTDLVSPSAWVRQICVWLFDIDPFENWIKAISGDWEAYEHAGASWPKVGNAAQALGRNLIVGAAGVGSVWRGNAAEAEQEFQVAVGNAAMALKTACDQYADLYAQAAEVAKQLFSAVGGLLGQFIDVLIIVNAAAAVGTATLETGIGAVAGYTAAAYYSWQAYDLYTRIASVYQNAEITIKGIAGAIEAIQAGLEVGSVPGALPPYRHPAVS